MADFLFRSVCLSVCLHNLLTVISVSEQPEPAHDGQDGGRAGHGGRPAAAAAKVQRSSDSLSDEPDTAGFEHDVTSLSSLIDLATPVVAAAYEKETERGTAFVIVRVSKGTQSRVMHASLRPCIVKPKFLTFTSLPLHTR